MPLPKDEFERRLDAAFDFLGDLLQNPEKIDDLPPMVHLFIGESYSPSTPRIDEPDASSDTNFSEAFVLPLATAQA